MTILSIDQISEVPSDIYYIKRFIGRVRGRDADGEFEFFLGFSLEKKPVGPPDVELKFIDPLSEEIQKEQEKIADVVRSMEQAGDLKHSPFEGI